MGQSATTIQLRVTATTLITQRVRAISLASADGKPLPGYSPGAHIEVEIEDIGTRSYSLIPMPLNTPSHSVYNLGILLEENSTGGSKFMHALKCGDVLTARTPKNDFPLEENAPCSILFAGGIGITPILAMAAHLKNTGADFTVHYAGRARGGLAFLEPLKAHIKNNLCVHYDDEDSALNIPSILNSAAHSTHIYVCGPKGMIEAVQKQALASGYPNTQIHIELFTPASHQAEDTEFEIELSSSGMIYTVPVGKTILQVLEEAGENPISDCARGNCGVCQTGVISGEIDHRDVVLSDAERIAGDVMQICVSRATGAKLILDM